MSEENVVKIASRRAAVIEVKLEELAFPRKFLELHFNDGSSSRGDFYNIFLGHLNLLQHSFSLDFKLRLLICKNFFLLGKYLFYLFFFGAQRGKAQHPFWLGSGCLLQGLNLQSFRWRLSHLGGISLHIEKYDSYEEGDSRGNRESQPPEELA